MDRPRAGSARGRRDTATHPSYHIVESWDIEKMMESPRRTISMRSYIRADLRKAPTLSQRVQVPK